jgi:hypothetical protein
MINKKTRVPLQVSERFAERLKELQRKVRMTTGTEKSLRELTDEIVSSEIFKDMEKNILKQGDIKMDIKIKLDRRIL